MVSSRHLIRFGCMGHIGRFDSPEGIQFPRRARVICRTVRGLEVGEILAVAPNENGQADGSLLRRVTEQDELLITRMERRKQRAFQACDELLKERNLSTVLMEVEHLFDGQSLFFYFLGDIDSDVQQLTDELAEAYEAKVQFRKFSQTLAEGCGPDCGTESASGGCSSGGCTTCALSSGCATKKSDVP